MTTMMMTLAAALGLFAAPAATKANPMTTVALVVAIVICFGLLMMRRKNRKARTR